MHEQCFLGEQTGKPHDTSQMLPWIRETKQHRTWLSLLQRSIGLM